jgi:hypothetical protein
MSIPPAHEEAGSLSLLPVGHAGLIRWFVGGRKDIWLARVALTLHARDNPVGRANPVPIFTCVNPPVFMEGYAALGTERLTRNVWTPEVSDYGAFWPVRFAITPIFRVISVHVPLVRLNHHGLLAELRHLILLVSAPPQ